MAWPELPISVDFTWCRRGLMEFHEDYPEPQRNLSANGLAEGLQQMNELLISRMTREEDALADMKLQRLLYDEEQRFVQYALALLLPPHEFFQSTLFTREEYIHACLVKVLVEQSIYNYSPFLLQSMPIWNEIMTKMNLDGNGQELLTRMIKKVFGHGEAPKEEPVKRPKLNRGYMTMYSGLSCYGDWFTPWGAPEGVEEPSRAELAMDLDQEKLHSRGLGRPRPRRKDSRPACSTFIPELMGRRDLGGETAAQTASLHDHTLVQFQRLHHITVQEAFQTNSWMKRG